jgi:hypothetical protein
MNRISTTIGKTGWRLLCALRRKVLPPVLLLLLLGLLLDLRGGGQNTVQQEIEARQSLLDAFPADNQLMTPGEEKRLAARNADRQKKMIADTDKLLTLAAELDDEVKCSNTGSLTPEQLRKVNEMEKLAHSVKEKMASPVLPPASSATPFSAAIR